MLKDILGGIIMIVGVLFVYALSVSALTAVFSVTYAWVAVRIWIWFVTPVFHVEAPKLVYMIGLFLFVGMFRGYSPDVPEAEDRPTWFKVSRPLMYGLLGPALTYFFGAVVHHFV